MTAAQNTVAALTLFALGAVAFVPPWVKTLTYAADHGLATVDEGPAGYAPVFAPPPVAAEGWSDLVHAGTRIDGRRLVITWAVVLAFGAAAVICYGPRRPG